VLLGFTNESTLQVDELFLMAKMRLMNVVCAEYGLILALKWVEHDRMRCRAVGVEVLAT